MNAADSAKGITPKIATGRAAPAGSRASGRPIGAPLACRLTPGGERNW